MDELLSFMEDLNDQPSDNDSSESPGIPDPSSSRKLSVSSSPLKFNNSSTRASTSSLQSQKSQRSSLSSSSTTVTTSTHSQSESRKKLSFNDVFGSPDKRDIKDFGLSSSSRSSTVTATSTASRRQTFSGTSFTSTATSGSSFSQSQGQRTQLELTRAIQKDNQVPYKPDNTATVIDPFSRVRVVKDTISIYFDESVSAEAVLKERNIGLEFVPLTSFDTWYRGKGKDTKNFWVSGVLCGKTSGVRKSAKGNDYCIWEVSDLKNLDKKVSLFLFSGATSSEALSTTPVGSIIDITTPSVMQTQDSSSSAIKFSVNNSSQVRFIGTSKDFGFCQGTRKNGQKCTSVVNTWECSFCIYHASAELKKMNVGSKRGKGKGNSKKDAFFPNKSFGGGVGGDQKEQGITIVNFGGKSFSNTTKTSETKVPPGSGRFITSRMELQGGNQEMKKNPMKFGNPENIKFHRNGGDHPLLEQEPLSKPTRKSLDLNPLKTRHLTDKDRELLQKLELNATDASKSSIAAPASKRKEGEPPGLVSDLITTSIVNNPNAASRNFMQFLKLQHAPKDQVDLNSTNKSSSIKPVVMSREKVESMQKALNFVKSNGPLKKNDPNAVSGKKRKLQSPNSSESESSSKKRTSTSTSSSSSSKSKKVDVEFDFDSDEFKRILNAKSAHDEELDGIKHEEYFEKLEKKEALENKLLTTYSIETNAVMCRECKYVALSQSDFCKERLHQVRVVKARKRFFKCKDCGNRTMSLDRLPKRPCANCNSTSWLVAPVGKERKGPKLPSEMLAVRGNEEKFVGSASSKMFLHLEM